VPPAELEKARALAKGRFVLQTESPNGLILFGLRREVLEGAAAEPTEVLAGLDAVTVEDVQRVAQDVIGGAGLRCALIGPFDDEAKFQGLL
jgi:predicted Zn-dependent peptidase